MKNKIIYREATIEDIDNFMIVRMAVKENILNNPALVPREENIAYLTKYGKGWVCEIDSQIVGFSIVGLTQRNVWALFVHPEFERNGIGGKLHDMLMDWYFNQTTEKIWLGTGPRTKAETFYKKRGWTEVGMHGNNEIKFEMTFDDWNKNRINRT
jgi:GNAT superfamily N-acetyltransferase